MYVHVCVCPASEVRMTEAAKLPDIYATWTVSRSPKPEAYFIFGQLPKFPHSSADSKWQVQPLVNFQVYIPGHILAVAEHCTPKQQSLVPDYVSALRDWVLRAFAHEPLQKERCWFLPEPAALHKNGGSVLSPNKVRLSSDVLPTLMFLWICREEIFYLLEPSNY